MRRFIDLTFAAALVAALASGASAQELLDDGAFDNATSGSLTSGSAWTLLANLPDGAGLAAQFQTGFANANNTGAGGTQAPGTGAGVWFRSFEGDQGNSGDPLADATLTQSVVAPLDGSYLLSFVAGREVDHLSQEFGVSLSSSGTGGLVAIDLLTATIPDGNLGGSASGNQGGTPFSLLLTDVTAGDTLSVVAELIGGEDNVGGAGQSAFLDNFSLTFVPEPTSAALASLAALGLAIRRRQ